MIPSLALEHFEHGDVFGIERVTLDLLKVHGLKAPLARRGNLLRGETIFGFGHTSNIYDPAQKIANLNRLSQDRFTLPQPTAQAHCVDEAAIFQEKQFNDLASVFWCGKMYTTNRMDQERMSQSTTLTVRLSPQTKKQLGRLAEHTKRTRSYLAGEAITSFVERELAIVEGIKRGLEDMHAGRVVPHKTAMRRLRKTVARASKGKT